GRALQAEFQPGTFLDDLSAALYPFVPHDRLGLGYLAPDGRTFSVFAEHGGPGFLPPPGRYATDLERAARFPVADSPLATVFHGHVLRIADLLADPGFVHQRDSVKTAGLRSAVIVPVMAGSSVIGELSTASA